MPSPEALKVVFSPFGVPLRDLLPEITNKWYMLLPVDTSVLGVKTYPLIADNQYIIGEIQINIEQDQLTVSSQYTDDRTVPLKTILHFYNNLEELTPKRIVYRYKGYQLDQPVKLERFGEDETLLMYLRIEGIFDERRTANTAFHLSDYTEELQDMMTNILKKE